ncbi:hypothetical protein BJY52DRAFT_1219997 [Lactarius psammicola]|nr:hypothetical protein BJY52DRAFT_1219997 [Lactarius psammicola]
MDDHQDTSQQANDLPANTFPRPAPSLHQLHGHVQHDANLGRVGDGQQDVHRMGVPQPVGNVGMQGEMRYPYINTPSYAAHYHPPPTPRQVPYVHMHQDLGVAEAVPAQARPFALDFPADNPGVFPGVWPDPAPPANMPLADLRDLAGRYLNNPDTHVNMLQIIEPGPQAGRGGGIEVRIVLQVAARCYLVLVVPRLKS